MKTNTLAFYEAIQNLDNARRTLSELTETYQISFEQFMLLKKLQVMNGVTPSELSDLLGVSKPAVSRKLNQLYQNDLLDKDRNKSEDQRVVRLKITGRGTKIVNELDRVCDKQIQQMSDPIQQLNAATELINTLAGGIVKTLQK